MEGPPAKKSKLSPSGDAQDVWTIMSDVESKLPDELGNLKTSYDITSADENGDVGRVTMEAMSSNHMNTNQVLPDSLSSVSSIITTAPQQHLLRQPLQQQHILTAQQRQILNSSQPQLVTILPPSSVPLPSPLQRFQIHISSTNNQPGARMLQLPLVINNNNSALLNANAIIGNNVADVGGFVSASNQQANVQPAAQNRQNIMTIMVPGRSGAQASIPQQIMLNGNVVGANQNSWSNNGGSNNVQQQLVGSTPSLVVMDNNNSQTSFVHNQTNMMHALVDNSMVSSVPRIKNFTFSATQQNQLQHAAPQQQQPILNINNIASLPNRLLTTQDQQQQQQNFLQTTTSTGGQPQSSSTSTPSSARTPGITDPNKQNLIRQQLVLLLHAHKCQKRDQSQNGAQGVSACKMPHCETMKKVLRHMAECQVGKACKTPHCASSRQIITHYKNCPRSDCSVCLPIKNPPYNFSSSSLTSPVVVPSVSTIGTSTISSVSASLLPSAANISQIQQPHQSLQQQTQHQGLVKAYIALGLTQQQIYQQTMAQQQEQQSTNGSNIHMSSNSMSVNNDSAEFGVTNGAGGGPNSRSAPSQLAGGMPEASTLVVKEWHKSITQDLRNHLVYKLVQAIFPTPDPIVLKDARIKNLVQYSRKVEGDMYEKANTREEYYHLLAEKIYRIQKELEEKKLKRSQLDGQQQLQPQLQQNSTIRFPTATSRQPVPNGPLSVGLRQQNMASNPGGVPNVLVTNNQAAASPNFISSSPQQQLQDLLIKHQRIGNLDQSSPQSRMFQVSPWPANHVASTSAPTPTALMSSLSSSPAHVGSGFLSPSSCFMSPSSVSNSDLGNFFGVDSIKKELGSHTPCDSQILQSSVKVEEGLTGDLSFMKPVDAVKSELALTPSGSNAKIREAAAKDKMQAVEIKSDDSFVDPNNDLLLHPTSSTSSAITPINKTVWKPNELRQYLLPTLEKLYRLDESLPFRQPVDPVILQIPDYFDIIKSPMDLSTIKKNLDTGGYSDPWQYVEDVWLMFENAWLYNRKTSRVHKFSTKLSEVFELEIDGVMRSLGFCCGRKYVFSPQALCCYGKAMCTIPINAVYYSHQNRYVFCEKCFLETEAEEMELNEDPMQPNIRIRKELFEKTKNNQLEMEPFVECTYCGKKHHQICSLYLEPVWQGSFVCMACAATHNIKRKENKYTAKRLPQTKLGTYLENRVNSFLKKNGCGAGEVTIRVLSSSEKTVEVKLAMKARHVDEIADTFPYTAKSIFAFEEIDGISVCFFGMHVQEYGSNCPQPNARRIYIAYLDSVNFFQPKVMRTPVYHEILIGYLDYVKRLGYATAHIWACPPSEGDDYIFHCHPPDMKIPKPKRLQDWYKKMLDKAILERIVVDYKDILRDAIENNLSSATELPYFEGDFWPTVLEDSIKEVEQEEDRKRKESENEALSLCAVISCSTSTSSINACYGISSLNAASLSFPDASMSEDQNSLDVDDGNTSGGAESAQSGKKKGQKSAVKKKSSKNKGGSSGSASSKKAGNKKNQPPRVEIGNGNELTSKLFQMMEKHKEVFFVVKLHPAQAIPSLPPVQDPDQFVANDLMDGRDAFLMMSRERHYEFSSLRRAKFSTLVMLYELHTQGREAFVYACNSCKANIETHYHCTVCDDFDLCVSCYEKLNHVHKMEKRSLDLDGSGPGGASGAGGMAGGNNGGLGSGEGSDDSRNSINQQEARRLSIQKCIQSLLHACTCRDANCRLASCQKMKRVMNHTKLCKRKQTNSCPVCKQLFALCWYHAKHCRESKCQVPFCLNFKQKLQQQQTQQKMQQAMLMRRRIEAMSQNGNSSGSSLSSSSSSLQTHQPNHTGNVPQKLVPPVVGVVPSTPTTHQTTLTNRLLQQQQQMQQHQLQQFQQQQQFQQMQLMDTSQNAILPISNNGTQQVIGTALVPSDSSNQLSALKLQLQQPLTVQQNDVQASSASTVWLDGMQQQGDSLSILMTTAASTSMATNFSVVSAITSQQPVPQSLSRTTTSSSLGDEKQKKILNFFQSNPHLVQAFFKQKQQQQFASAAVLLNQQQQIQEGSQPDHSALMKQQQARLLLGPRLQSNVNSARPAVLVSSIRQPQHVRLAQQSVPSPMIRLPNDQSQLILQNSSSVNAQQQQLVKMQQYHPVLNNVAARTANPLLRAQLQQQQLQQQMRMASARMNLPVSLGLNSSSLQQHQVSVGNPRTVMGSNAAVPPIMLLTNNNDQIDAQQSRQDQVMLTQLHSDLPSTNNPSNGGHGAGFGDANSAVVIPQDQLSRYADQL